MTEIQMESLGGADVITRAQLRAARGLLDWTQPKLAKAAGVSVPTIKRAEHDLGVGVSSVAYQKIATALLGAGVIFLQDDDGPGGKLRHNRAD
jgi:transcriptional regulator with XRE-family HTH domain